MGNTPSQEAFKVNGKPLSAFYDHEKVGTTVVTRSSFLYYNDKTHQLINTVPTKRSINYVALNYDLDLFITGEDDFLIRLYKASDGSFINSLPPVSATPQEIQSFAHNDQIKVIQFMDDKHIISGSTDGSIRIWNIESGEMTSVFVVSLPGRSAITDTAVSSITSLAYDSKRDIVIAGCADGVIRKFSMETRAVIGTFEGHNRGAILNLVVSNQGHLISSSMDETIRVWNIETCELICGSIFFAQAFHYDTHRDILFAASDNGNVAVIKVESDNQDKYNLKKLSVLDFKLPALLNLYYNTYSDSMTVTSIEANIGFLQNVTGIPYQFTEQQQQQIQQRRLKSNSISGNNNNNDNNEKKVSNEEDDHSDAEDVDQTVQLPSEQIDTLLKQLTEIENNPDLIKRWNVQTLSNERLSKLSQLGSDLFLDDDEISQIRLKKYSDGIQQLQSTRTELEDEFKHTIKSLLNSKATKSVLHTDTSRIAKEMRLEQQRQELLDRHRREIEEFQKYFDNEMEQFDQLQPAQSNVTAHRFINRTSAYEQAQADLEAALNEHISTSFPVIASKYHIGGIVSETATNVFGGFDAQALSLVAIKLMPPGVQIISNNSDNSSTQHRHLTKVIETASTPQATYVVMESCSLDLTELVGDYKDHLLPIDTVKTIMYQLLDALAHLHANKMVKRDLTPSAVMVGEDSKIRITHLGLMKALTGQIENECTIEEGVLYGAPELFCRVITTESDMWAAGTILVYLLQNEEERLRPLFEAHDLNSMIASTVRVVGRPTSSDIETMLKQCTVNQAGKDLLYSAVNQPVPLEDTIDVLKKHISRTDIDNDAFNLIQQLLTFVPQNRISAQQALTHRFFTNKSSSPSTSTTNVKSSTTTTTTTTTTTSANNEISEQTIVGSTPVLKPLNSDVVSPDTNNSVSDNNLDEVLSLEKVEEKVEEQVEEKVEEKAVEQVEEQVDEKVEEPAVEKVEEVEQN